jgi:F-type H+-transporting ATPase subunit gamma
MWTLEGLSDALATTDEIRSIVRTMKALSAASIRQYERAEAALGDYERTVELGLMAVLRDRRARGEVLTPQGPGGTGSEALIVVGSDRGLCGRYNDTVVRFAQDRIGPQTRILGVLGARAAARLEAMGHPPDRVLAVPGGVAGLAPVVQRVIIDIDRWTRDHALAGVRLLHNRRVGASLAQPVEEVLLPLSHPYLEGLATRDWPGPGLPAFRAPPGELTSWLVQQRLFVIVYRALSEALASEHATRLAAMQRAERNIDARREDLTALYRQMRQQTITRELLDVVAGFEAVSTGR